MQIPFGARKPRHQPLSIETCPCYRGYLGNVIKEDESRFRSACETTDALSSSRKLNNLSWKHPSCGEDETGLGGDEFTVLLEPRRRLPHAS